MSVPLPQLRVATPCPTSWESMQGDHRTRFCDQCQLHVHNVSAMTAREAHALLAAAPGRLCLNGFARPDGELVTQESLADLLELHGAAPERVAAVRAAVTAGLTAVALALAACSDPTPRALGGDLAPRQQGEQPPSPAPTPPRTVGIAPPPPPQPETKAPPMMTGGAPAPFPPEESPPNADQPR